MAIQGFFTGDVKIKDLNGVLKAVNGVVEVATDAGTVTSVGLTVGSTGTDVNVANSPVTTSGNITLNLPTASATNRGLLSSADWTTFNSKQGTITLTTTGSSGAATLIGTTLNIPNYSGALTGYVPYTGATTNVDLGEYGISSGYFQADLTPSGTLQVGRMQWNSTDGTMDLRLMGNNVTLQIGQEQVARVVNGTGGNLLEANYQAVKIIGAQGQRLQVGLARADNDANSKDTLGLVTENINNNQEGFITVSGLVNEINTTGSLQGETWADGDTLYLSGTTSGAITNVKPTAPIHTVIVGFVIYAHANHGKIFVKVDNGYELEELHDVAPTPYVNKGVLYRDTATNLWKSATIGTLLGYTPANAATTLTINGTAYDLSANRTWNVGTVTSIGTSGPLTGGTITGSGTIGITQSSAASDGYLSNTDWTTFNNKQTALNGTGFVKISGTTISYDNSTYYLASNPSAFIALTALSATAPLSYDNTTGVFSISQATTSTNGYLSSTDWNTFNNKQAAGSYITALTGEATASGPGSANVTLSTSAVTGKILTGLNLTGGGTIADTDSILQAFGKVQNQISGLAGGVTYQGVWNASTNTPTLTSSVGTKGYYYIVDVAGSTNLNGITDWKVGDWVIFNGSTWDKVDNTDAVSSVNGFTGAVSLTTSNIAEGTNLYYLDSRARLALSFTAGSGAYDNTTGVITIPTNTSQLTNGANFITLSSLSASSPLSYNSGTGALSIQVANGSQNGYLSSTDWTTFNSKQAAGNYVTTDTVQTITALKTFTSKVTLNTGGTDDQLQIVGTAPSVRLTNAVTGATINGFIAMSGANDNYIQGSVSGDMTIGNQNNGKILFGFGSGTSTQKLSLDSSGNAVLAGGLTLGSTLSNGTYTYTLPSATGTLALVGGAGVGTVTSIATTGPITGGTITSTGTIGITQATTSTDGYLSSTDWNTFNSKQAALTNPVTGTGTTNTLPKFTGASTIGNSNITDTGSLITLGSNSYVNGNLAVGSNPTASATLHVQRTTDGNMAIFRGTSNAQLILSIASGVLTYNSSNGSAVHSFQTNETERLRIDSSGGIGIGTSSLTGYNLRVSKNITGATISYGITSDGVTQNGVTNQSHYFSTIAQTAATTFTTSTLFHYRAIQGTFGAGSTVTAQHGFFVDNTLTGATNNFGFYGNIPSGTNRWNLFMNGTANNYMAGSLGIGSTSVGSGINLNMAKTMTGATAQWNIYNQSQVQSDVTANADYFRTNATTQAATFTLPSLVHYRAFQGTFGAGSTVSNQYGFIVTANLTGATNNYGFFGDIASGTNRWNIYMNGTANNYMGGSLGIGTTALTGYNLRVLKNITGAGSSYGISSEGVIQSDATLNGFYYNTVASTAAATFTTGNIVHYFAQQGTFGAGSSVTRQYGFFAAASLIGGTNNFGFYGDIASGTNRWNLYMNGTANNYMAGSLGIGTTTISTKLSVFTAAGGNTSGFSVGSTVGLLNIWGGASSGVVFDVTNGTLNGATGTDLLFRQGGATVMLINSSQQVGIGVSSVNSSSAFQVDSITRGFLPPRMTSAQRTAIASPATGLIVYQTDGVEGLWVNTSTGWRELTVV